MFAEWENTVWSRCPSSTSRPIVEGGDAADAFRNSLDLARHAERLGLPPLLAGRAPQHARHRQRGDRGRHRPRRRRHLDHPRRRRRHHAAQPRAARDRRAVRHARVAVPRARSTSASAARPAPTRLTARALRRNLQRRRRHLPQDVVELMALLPAAQPPASACAPSPARGWTCRSGSSARALFGAQLAAELGLPFAFASHFAPDAADAGARSSTARSFKPSRRSSTEPYVMVGVNVFAADTDEEARRLFTSLQQAFVNLRRGQPGKLPPPDDGIADRLTPRGPPSRQRDARVLRGRLTRDGAPRARRRSSPAPARTS